MEKYMKIKDWPSEERPREKLVRYGVYYLSDAELLAIIIGKGIKKKNALDLARELLNHFGDLKTIGQRSVAELVEIKGLGWTKAVEILAALELGRRSLVKRDTPQKAFRKPEDLYEYYYPLIGHLKYEVFKVILTDGRNRLIKDSTISKGILDASLVHPREVFALALTEKANAIFLIHNHPSGNPKPSEDDIKITERLVRAGEIMGIKILDHIIIAEDGYYSFAEKRLL